MTASVTVRVREGWAVFDGEQQRSGGAVLTAPADLAAEWQAAGLVEPVARPKPKPTTAP